MQDIIAYDNIIENLQNVREYTNTMNAQWSNINNNFSNIDNSFKNINNSVNQAKIDEGYEYRIIGMPYNYASFYEANYSNGKPMFKNNLISSFILHYGGNTRFNIKNTQREYEIDQFTAPYDGNIKIYIYQGANNNNSTSVSSHPGSVDYYITDGLSNQWLFKESSVNAEKGDLESGYLTVKKGKTYIFNAIYTFSSRYTNAAHFETNSIIWLGQIIKCHSNSNKIFLQK